MLTQDEFKKLMISKKVAIKVAFKPSCLPQHLRKR